jgi:hypothetical protein
MRRPKTLVSTALQPDALYEEGHVAKAMRCNVKTLQAWRMRGCGPQFLKIGRLVRYRGSDIARWMETRLMCSTSSTLPQDAA